MTLASTKHTVVVPNSSSLISGSNIAPGESFWFNTSNGNSYFSQSVIANKLSGSLQTLADGVTQAFIAGPGIIVGFQDNGQVAISSSISAPESFWYSDFSATIKTTGSFQASGSGVVKQDLNVSGNTAVNRLWVTASSGTALSVSGASSFAGAASFTGGLSGSLQRTTSGLSYLIGSGNITINSQSNGQVAVSVSFGAPADASYLALSTNATLTNERVFTPGVGIGVVDGGANGTYTVSASLRAGPNITINTEGNTLVITGAAGGGGGSGDANASYLVLALTSSLNNERQIVAGPGIIFNDLGANNLFEVSASFVAGPGIIITSQSNGQIAVSASGGGGGGTNNTFLPAASYAVTFATTSNPQACGQFGFVPTEHNSGSIFFRAILSQETAATASVRVWNFTSGAYVDLGGPGIFALSASSATPTSFTSVNLKTTAGWTNGNAVYEVRLHTSDGTKAATLGSAVIITTP